MKMKLSPALLLILFSIVALPNFAISQTETPDLKARQKDLEKLRREIDDYEEKIKKSERREKSTLETLDYYERQGLLIRRLLRKLKEESTRLQREIEELQRSIGFSENQLQAMKHHYARYLASIYKYGRLHDLELLLTANSINQRAIRVEYLRRYSTQRQREISSIAWNKSQLEEHSRALQTKLREQERLIAQKAVEESRIKRKAREKQKLLASIRKDVENYRRELRRKTAATAEVERIIADLVERERFRREREADKNRLPVEGVPPGAAFSNRRGRLPWPVSGGTIAARFGNQIHPVLKTVTHNTGIDISVPAGADVRAVAAGEVAMISWLPSYGNLLIINHDDGYRTVYTHLSEIFVGQGQKVREGETIGKSGESIAGPVLHFEIWKDREKLDPELWLSRR